LPSRVAIKALLTRGFCEVSSRYIIRRFQNINISLVPSVAERKELPEEIHQDVPEEDEIDVDALQPEEKSSSTFHHKETEKAEKVEVEVSLTPPPPTLPPPLVPVPAPPVSSATQQPPKESSLEVEDVEADVDA